MNSETGVEPRVLDRAGGGRLTLVFPQIPSTDSCKRASFASWAGVIDRNRGAALTCAASIRQPRMTCRLSSDQSLLENSAS